MMFTGRGPLEVDATSAARNWLAAWFAANPDGDTALRVVTELPSNLTGLVARVHREGGGDDGRTLDIPTIVTDWFAGNDIDARELASRGCAAYRQMVGVVLPGSGLVTRVEKLSGPFPNNYENTAVRQQVTLHRLYLTSALVA